MAIGMKLCAAQGVQFALQLHFMNEQQEIIGDYMVVSTELFDDMVKQLDVKTSVFGSDVSDAPKKRRRRNRND